MRKKCDVNQVRAFTKVRGNIKISWLYEILVLEYEIAPCKYEHCGRLRDNGSWKEAVSPIPKSRTSHLLMSLKRPNDIA